MTVASPWRRPVLAGFAVLVVAVLVVAGGRSLVETGIVIEPVGPTEEPATLPVPEVGSVAPGYLENGTPVFVSHPEEGTVLVLDATSPHQENKLVAYCASSELFEDLYHGSRFTGWGDWIAGPSPTGMLLHPHELLAEGQRLRVTGPVGAGSERTQPRGPADVEPQGPACEPGYDDLSFAVGHRPPVVPPTLDGGEVPADRWVWAGLVLGGTHDDPRVCDADGTCPSDAPSALPNLGTSEIADQFLEPTQGVWLARATGDGAVQLRRPALPVDGPVEDWPQGVLPVPAPGEVLAVYGWNHLPLFVVTATDGATLVLDATSPRHPTDLLGWCPQTGGFVDGSGARYDRSGQAINAGAPMHRSEHQTYDLGRGGLRAAHQTWGARGLEAPPFTPEAVPGAGPQIAPCTEILTHGPSDGEVEELPNDWFDGVFAWRWIEAAVHDVNGQLRLCVGSQTCDGPDDPLVVSPGADTVTWPQDPQLLYVRREDSREVDADEKPYQVHIRRPLLPVRP